MPKTTTHFILLTVALCLLAVLGCRDVCRLADEPPASAPDVGAEAQDIPEEIKHIVRRFRAAPDYKFVGALSTNIGICTGAHLRGKPYNVTEKEYVVGCLDRSWIVHVPAPELLRTPYAISPDSRKLAAYGLVLDYMERRKKKEPTTKLEVIDLKSGKVLWEFSPPHSLYTVKHIEWIGSDSFAYAHRLPPKTRKPLEPYLFVIRRVYLATGKEETLYESPDIGYPGATLWDFRVTNNGKYLLIREEGRPARFGDSTIYLYDVDTKKKTRLPIDPHSVHPFTLAFTDRDRSIYFEDKGGAGTIPLSNLTERKSLMRTYDFLGVGPYAGWPNYKGDKIVFGHQACGSVYLVNTANGKSENIFRTEPEHSGATIRYGRWSQDDRFFVGLVSYRWRLGDGSAAGAEFHAFVIDFKEKEITFFRSTINPRPLYFVEDEEVLKALRKRSVKWND